MICHLTLAMCVSCGCFKDMTRHWWEIMNFSYLNCIPNAPNMVTLQNVSFTLYTVHSAQCGKNPMKTSNLTSSNINVSAQAEVQNRQRKQ